MSEKVERNLDEIKRMLELIYQELLFRRLSKKKAKKKLETNKSRDRAGK